jgi:phosphoribosylformylglycinamidine (FGAM) synthase PurS component
VPGPNAGHHKSTQREADGCGSMKARIKITLKNGVLDPQGKASARDTVDRMCKDLLANMVIENYAFELVR